MHPGEGKSISRLGAFAISATLVVAFSSPSLSAFDVSLKGGDVVRIEAVAPDIFRVRLSTDGRFSPSLMERYAIVRSDWPIYPASLARHGAISTITAGSNLLDVGDDGAMCLKDSNGLIICRRIMPLRSHLDASSAAIYSQRQKSLADYFDGEQRGTDQGSIVGEGNKGNLDRAPSLHPFDLAPGSDSFGASFEIGTDERFYGLGTASARRIQLRGHAYRLWTQYRGNFGFESSKHDWDQTEGPIPLLLSTGGWGVFVNTTWVHYYDIGRIDRDQTFFWGPEGNLDFFLMRGASLPRLLELYTEITGKPRLQPEFSYGLTYSPNIMTDQHEVLEDLRLFREEGIPCDTVGLEPQWMKKHYDFSHDVEWNSPDRFYMEPWELADRGATLIGACDRLGFKLSLWICCDDDLTIDAERSSFEHDKKEFPNEPEAWFNHLRKFVKQGVRAFKMDPANLVQEHPKRTYFNGAPDLENHNLTQVLYHKQMCEGYETLTGERAFNHYCGAYAGVQHWGATTMGDSGGGHRALVCMLNYAMSAHMNTSCDMELEANNLTLAGQPSHSNTPYDSALENGGIHFGFLQPWSEHNNWAFAQQPWLLGPKAQEIYKFYAGLRYSLIPYIYSTAYEGYKTAMPIMRPMPLMFEDDRKLDDCSFEYMLGQNLLVVVYSEKAYLPRGKWIDYWTGREFQGPIEIPCSYPDDRAGGLFIRAGAIIPYWPQLSHVGARNPEVICLQIYPDNHSSFTLYEDDGESLQYLNGATSTTEIKCDCEGGSTSIAIGPRVGSYAGMPDKRVYDIRVHVKQPQSVRVSGGAKVLPYDSASETQTVVATEDDSRRAPIVLNID
jgi:alpha-glucosidase (family GH31 glycosyl hydrolase)